MNNVNYHIENNSRDLNTYERNSNVVNCTIMLILCILLIFLFKKMIKKINKIRVKLSDKL